MTAQNSPTTDLADHIWSETDRGFALRLIADARALGLAEIRYKDLTVRFTPADSAPAKQRQSSWSATMPRFVDPQAAYVNSLQPKDP